MTDDTSYQKAGGIRRGWPCTDGTDMTNTAHVPMVGKLFNHFAPEAAAGPIPCNTRYRHMAGSPRLFITSRASIDCTVARDPAGQMLSRVPLQVLIGVFSQQGCHRLYSQQGSCWGKEKAGGLRLRPRISWWAMLDLNQRPHPCEGCALPLSQSPLARVILSKDGTSWHEKPIFLQSPP